MVLRQHGIADAQVSACASRQGAAPDAARALDTCVAQRTRGPTVDAVGRATVAFKGQHCAAAVVVRRLAEFLPPPERAAAFDALELRAVTRRPSATVSWLCMDPRGRVTVLPDRDEGTGTHRATAHLHAGEGRYRLQLTVDDGRGPEVAAVHDVWAGSAATEPARPPAPPGDGADGLAEALRLWRAREGLPSLRVDPALAGAARTRLEALRAGGALQHLDARGMGVVQAYAAQPAAPAVARLGEVLAAGPTPADALRGLLDSPAHRQQLADPAFTGVGLALERQEALDDWLLVVTLGRPVEIPAPGQARDVVLARLNDERRRRALPPLAGDETLAALASEHARHVAGTRELVDTLPDGRRVADVALAHSSARRAGLQMYRVSRADEVGAAGAVLDGRYARAAVATVPGQGVDGLYVVVILLEP
ncbi:MAG: hypothetical protein HY904_10395 [Deltaproteobacteria bacterium]|nr:hypothetical protein [Deltaproteobacteria bacterium]